MLGRALPKGPFRTQRALRDRLMSRGKNCLPTVSRQFLTRNYPRPNCLLKCLPNCLSPTREDFLSSFKINPAVRVIARQVRDKNCLAAVFAPRHQSVSSGPLGTKNATESKFAMGKEICHAGSKTRRKVLRNACFPRGKGEETGVDSKSLRQ